MGHHDKDLNRLLERVRAVGWPVRKTSRGHFMVTPPSGPQILCAASSDVKAIKNTICSLKRAGFFRLEALLNVRDRVQEPEATEAPTLEMQAHRPNHEPIPEPAPAPAPTLEAAPTPAPARGPDPHFIGMVRLGRLVERLDLDERTMSMILELLGVARGLELTVAEVQDALQHTA